MRRLISMAAAAVLAAASAQAAPVTAIALNPGITTITVLEDDSNLLNNHRWLTFSAVAGTQIRLFVDSANNTKDPCQELYFGDVNGVDFGGRNGDCSARNGAPELTFVTFNDDWASGQPDSLSSLISVTAAQTGTYSLLVTDLGFNNVRVNLDATFTPPRNDVPVPATLALAGLGLALLGGARRRA